jgi:hypothetical protein
MSTKWDIKLNLTSLLLLLIITVGLLFGARAFFQKNREITRLGQNIATLESGFETYRSQATGEIISYRQSLELYQSELEDALKSDSINREMAGYYKKLSEQVTIVTEYVHDSIPIPVPYPVAENIDTIIPYNDNCMDLNFVFSDGFTYLSDINIPNQQDIIVGMRKNGLSKAYWAVDVHNSNPCIRVTDIQSTHVVTKKRWWENPMIVGTVGILIGVVGWEVIR